MDHLDGVLAIDRAVDRDSFCTREEYERQGRPPGRDKATAPGGGASN